MVPWDFSDILDRNRICINLKCSKKHLSTYYDIFINNVPIRFEATPTRAGVYEFNKLVKNPRCARELICRIFLHTLKYNGFIINLLKDSHYVIYNNDNIYFFFEYDLLLLVSTSFSTLTVSLEVSSTYMLVKN